VKEWVERGLSKGPAVPADLKGIRRGGGGGRDGCRGQVCERRVGSSKLAREKGIGKQAVVWNGCFTAAWGKPLSFNTHESADLRILLQLCDGQAM
jgi:hypothetical protein